MRNVVPRIPAAPTGVLTTKVEPLPWLRCFTLPTSSPRLRWSRVLEMVGSASRLATTTLAENGSCRNCSITNDESAPSWVVAPLENTRTTLELLSLPVVTVACSGTESFNLIAVVAPLTVMVTVPETLAATICPAGRAAAGAGAWARTIAETPNAKSASESKSLLCMKIPNYGALGLIAKCWRKARAASFPGSRRKQNWRAASASARCRGSRLRW